MPKLPNLPKLLLICSVCCFVVSTITLAVIYFMLDEPVPIDDYRFYMKIKANYSTENLSRATKDINALLDNSIRILCLCTTSGKFHRSRAIFVKATWAQRCSKTIFISDQHDLFLDTKVLTTKNQWSDLWAKTRLSFQWAYDHMGNDYDWFVKADDDTFLIVENLRLFLSNFNPDESYYFGRNFLSGDDPVSLPKDPKNIISYASGGSGYVLSKEALRQLVTKAFPSPLHCSPSDEVQVKRIMEDIEIARCLKSVGVKITDTRDSMERQRFHPFAPEKHLMPGGVGEDDWIRVHDAYRYVEGPDCCSTMPISFHYVDGQKMLQLEYLIYRLKVFGITKEENKESILSLIQRIRQYYS